MQCCLHVRCKISQAVMSAATTFVSSHPLRPLHTRSWTGQHCCPTQSIRQPHSARRQRSIFRSDHHLVPNCTKSPPPSSSAGESLSVGNGTNSEDVAISEPLPGTPCFTPRILASPMTRPDREVYLSAITSSVDEFLSSVLSSESRDKSLPCIGQVTLLVPQLNPVLDVYDRRFLLQLTWAVISSMVSRHGLRTRVLIQGRRTFGAIPLSVAGLRRHFDADLEISAADWSQTIRSGDLENEEDLDDDDDVIIVISPTNAVSLPIVNSVLDCARRAKGRPIILINPRLDDVPSHSGVMQVSGRADRMAFLETFEHAFYLRLLFDAGSSYPLRGILYRSFPQPWQIWRSIDVDQDYRLIGEKDTVPNSSDISDAFKLDSFQRGRERLQKESSASTLMSLDNLLKPQFIVIGLALLFVVAVPFLQNPSAVNRFLSLLSL